MCTWRWQKNYNLIFYVQNIIILKPFFLITLIMVSVWNVKSFSYLNKFHSFIQSIKENHHCYHHKGLHIYLHLAFNFKDMQTICVCISTQQTVHNVHSHYMRHIEKYICSRPIIKRQTSLRVFI